MDGRLRGRRVTVAVLAVAALALVARLALLGERLAHWDEARVAWWQLRYLETGSTAYFPILHGPLLFHVNRVLFAALGPSDWVMRLPVAVVGAALPLSALALRTRLDDAETVALAVLLAADPVLLYYSRFARNDLLVGAFAFGAFALLVAAHDRGRARYAVAAAPLLALAVASKENALLYVLCWLGAVPLAAFARERADADPRDLRGHTRATVAVGRRQARAAGRAVARHPGALLAGIFAFLVVVVALFAPRGSFEPSLGAALADPALWPAVVAEATVGSVLKLVDLWLLGGLQSGGSYPWYLLLLGGTTIGASLAVAALGAYGTYRAWRRPLVGVTAAWALLSLAGYPLASDIVGGWTAVHVVVPLAVPAAVGLAALGRRARPVLAGGAIPGDRGARRAALVLVVLAAQVTAVGGLSSYVLAGHEYNMVGQPAQGDDDLKPTVEAAVAVAHQHRGVDVAFFGEFWVGASHKRQPFAWYLRAADHGREGRERVRTTVVPNRSAMPADPPPVVVALSTDRAALDDLLPGYDCFRHEMDYWSPREPGGESTKALVYVEEDALAEVGLSPPPSPCGDVPPAVEG